MKKLLGFAAGLILGSAATYFITKKKYEKIANEEIEAIREHYKNKLNKEVEKKFEEQKEEVIKETKKELDQYVQYTQPYSTCTDDEVEVCEESDSCVIEEPEMELIESSYDESEIETRPYAIPPSAFGEDESYMQIFLTLYSDGVLADDTDDIVYDIEGTVGEDFADHFGEFDEEPDLVCICNDVRKAYFEIDKDDRRYEDVVWRPPHMI